MPRIPSPAFRGWKLDLHYEGTKVLNPKASIHRSGSFHPDLLPIDPPLAERGTVPVHCSPTMLSGILIFNQKGENLIFRSFRNDCRPRLADVFRIQVISNAQVRSPILTLGSTTFSHVKHENIYLVAITKSNANAALVFEFLYRLIQLGKGYFGKFDEEAVKNNFVLVYELLDGKCLQGNWRPD